LSAHLNEYGFPQYRRWGWVGREGPGLEHAKVKEHFSPVLALYESVQARRDVLVDFHIQRNSQGVPLFEK
jgi:hypothetical protein